MMQKVYLLCGVPGSGKSWVMEKLVHLFKLVMNDLHIQEPRHFLVSQVKQAAHGDKPVLVDCPFAEREFREQLIAAGLNVEPVFIVESPAVVAHRYKNREGKEASKNTLTRAVTIEDRAREWGAHYGTSSAVLQYLTSVGF